MTLPAKNKDAEKNTLDGIKFTWEDRWIHLRKSNTEPIMRIYAEAKKYSVVRDFCGNGIGKQFHTPPSVLHYGNLGEGPELRPGMFFTIEPMINLGDWKVKILNDGWTAVTKDRSLSAQFEHTIGITDEGNEIFTLSENNTDFPINEL